MSLSWFLALSLWLSILSQGGCIDKRRYAYVLTNSPATAMSFEPQRLAGSQVSSL
jgi:hypothetical protein